MNPKTKKIPIQIPIRDIPEDGLDIRIEQDGAKLDLTGEFTPLTAVLINARIVPRGGIYQFSGLVETKLEVKCSRCLEKFPWAIKAQFKINYEPAIYQSEESHGEVLAIELGEKDLDISYYADDFLPIGNELREAVLLAIPTVPHCSESCLGLCPICGKNRNEVNCKCSAKDHDQRWSQLAALKKNLEEK